MKYLLLALVIVVVYSLYKAHKRKAARRPRATATGEDMVRCAQCGVHLPRSESLMNGELFFCTPEHRRLHQSPQ